MRHCAGTAPAAPPHPAANRQVHDRQEGRTGVVLNVLDGRLILGPPDGHGAPWETDISNVSLLFPLDTYPVETL